MKKIMKTLITFFQTQPTLIEVAQFACQIGNLFHYPESSFIWQFGNTVEKADYVFATFISLTAVPMTVNGVSGKMIEFLAHDVMSQTPITDDDYELIILGDRLPPDVSVRKRKLCFKEDVAINNMIMAAKAFMQKLHKEKSQLAA